jgi:hypothetical protein
MALVFAHINEDGSLATSISNPFDCITAQNNFALQHPDRENVLLANLENTYHKLGTGYSTPRLAGKPHTVNKVFLLHSDTALTIHYIHSGRSIEKTFTGVDACLLFALERFGVVL